jgi:peptidoglycan/LPS O-acetylase OafA/YrhL
MTTTSADAAGTPDAGGFLKAHIPQLDGLRGIAILLVLAQHTLGGSRRDSIQTVADLVAVPARCGWVGVDLFFVLSGFLITRILLQTRDAKNRYYVFYARRALRIWPVYFPLVFAALLANPWLPSALQSAFGARSWVLIFLFCQNLPAIGTGVALPAILAPTWSLAVEEQFYLLWPTLCFHLTRRRVMLVALFTFLMSPVARLLLFHFGVAPGAVYYWTPTRLDGLALGALVAAYVSGRDASPERLARVSRYAAWLAVPTAVLLLWRFAGSRPMNDMRPENGDLAAAAVYSLNAVTFAAILGLALTSTNRWLDRVLSLRPLRWFGKISYGLYLVHLPLLELLGQAARPTSVAAKVAFMLGGVTGAVLVAAASWRYYESRILRLKPAYE